MLTTVSGELRTLPNELLVRHYSRFYAQLSLRDYMIMQMSSCCAIIEQHQYSGPSIISYREQIEKLSSTDNTRCI